MRDQVEFPADQTVTRETGYDSDSNQVIRVEVRALLSYSRTLVDNNNSQLPARTTPGFRLEDLNFPQEMKRRGVDDPSMVSY